MVDPDNHSRLHRIWSCMKYRCKRNKQYAGRGITVCNEWESYKQFAAWARENGYRDDLTIERIDVDGNYCPENCVWIPFELQARNRTTTHKVEYNGKVMSLAEAAEICGISYKLAHERLMAGWSVNDALETPTRSKDSLAKKCRERGVNYKCVQQRIKKLGWSEERALSTPTLGIGANQVSYHHA